MAAVSTNRGGRAPLRQATNAAIEVFVFRDDTFLRSEVFRAERELTVGRDDSCDLRLEADTISRIHCSLRVEAEQLRVRDLQSVNGVWIDQLRVVGEQSFGALSHLRIGPFSLRAKLLRPRRAGSMPKATLHEITKVEPINEGMDHPHRARRPSSLRLVSSTPENQVDEPPEQLTPLALSTVDELNHLISSLESPAGIDANWGEDDRRRSDLLVEPDRPIPADEEGTDMIEKGVTKALKPKRPIGDNAQAADPHGSLVSSPKGGRAQPILARLVTPANLVTEALEVSVTVLKDQRTVGRSRLVEPGEQYVLGHPTPEGSIAPYVDHRGLRLVRMHPDGRVDMVFPKSAGGWLQRGQDSIQLVDLSQSSGYSGVRLEHGDRAEVRLGEGANAVFYRIVVTATRRDQSDA